MLTSNSLVDHLYYNKLPQVYRDMDSSLITKPLYRYLKALSDGGFLEALQGINGLLDLVDPEKCPEEFLAYLCESFGLEYFEDISPVYQRRFLLNVGEIIRRRGTYSCVKFMARVLTNMDVELQYLRGEYNEQEGRHLIITLLADTLEQILNMDTSIKVIERYIGTQIPYYIYPHVTSRVKTQVVQSKVYRVNVLSSTLSYNLLPKS